MGLFRRSKAPAQMLQALLRLILRGLDERDSNSFLKNFLCVLCGGDFFVSRVLRFTFSLLLCVVAAICISIRRRHAVRGLLLRESWPATGGISGDLVVGAVAQREVFAWNEHDLCPMGIV